MFVILFFSCTPKKSHTENKLPGFCITETLNFTYITDTYDLLQLNNTFKTVVISQWCLLVTALLDIF